MLELGAFGDEPSQQTQTSNFPHLYYITFAKKAGGVFTITDSSSRCSSCVCYDGSPQSSSPCLVGPPCYQRYSINGDRVRLSASSTTISETLILHGWSANAALYGSFLDRRHGGDLAVHQSDRVQVRFSLVVESTFLSALHPPIPLNFLNMDASDFRCFISYYLTRTTVQMNRSPCNPASMMITIERIMRDPSTFHLYH